MNAGSVKFNGQRMVLAAVTAMALTMFAVPALAQTPDAACAADSLYLISPEMLDLKLETGGKEGLTISWPNLDLGEATCFSLDGTDNLDFDVVVDGGFGDRVDRVFRFSTADAGVIGGANPGNITIAWQNQGPATNGNIGGVFNLSNNGGFWAWDTAGDSWAQLNNGLPMIWQRTNVTALDRGTGDFMVAAFTSGISLESTSTGLYTYNGTNWARLAPEVFDEDVRVTAIEISATDNNSFAVGTDSDGMFVTTDGGANFTQWTSELDPAEEIQATYRVTTLNWESSRLMVFMTNFGLFVSEDNAATFDRSVIEVPSTLELDVSNPEMVLPTVTDFAIDPTDADHIVAALLFHGAYETRDGGGTWTDLYGDLVVPDPTGIVDGAWVNSGRQVVFDAADPQIIVLAVSQKGLYRTTNGGTNWSLVGDAEQPANRAQLQIFSLINRDGRPGEMLVMEDNWKLLHSTDSGATWTAFAEQPRLNTGVSVVSVRDGSGDFIIGSNGGGIYVAGTTLELKDTYSTVTSPELRDLDLGLRVTFNGGNVNGGDEFELVAQTFQGWAVWRGPSHTPGEMTLIGLYDRVNPEDCFEGFCGDNSLEIVPQCFAAKRAACFDLSDPDTIRFFDEEVYNGFSYMYAVSSFDYGNTALTTPQNNTNELLFSPRFADDDVSPYSGPGNRTRVDINEPAAAARNGDPIYAYPNPVRLGAGVPRGEGNLVIFTNLPESSRVRIFTTAGDDVINLGPGNQTGGQMYWRIVNRDGQEVSAGVYLYKVESPEREDYWGRIVVIR